MRTHTVQLGLCWLSVSLAVVACSRTDDLGAALSSDNPYYAALTHPDRPEADRARDAERRPAEILALVGVDDGMAVLDLMVGAGWYTEVLARAVGSTGRVIAHNSPLTDERYGAKLRDRLAGDRLPNVEALVQDVDALEITPDSLDAVFLVQFYHDTFWMGVDRDAMNRAVFAALKPGGVYLVIDHSASPGTGAEHAETLHRIDEAIVRDEIAEAGFRLANESQVLRNDHDSRRSNVFRWSIRGQTDRFALKFMKPRR